MIISACCRMKMMPCSCETHSLVDGSAPCAETRSRVPQTVFAHSYPSSSADVTDAMERVRR